MKEPFRILVVCLGNICRSPTAEALLRDRIERSTLAGRVEVDSAGTGDWHVGHPPDPRTVACAARHGLDITHLRGRQITARDLDTFDLVLCADHANLRDVRALAPRAHQHVALLLGWSGTEGDGDVPDPYTGDAAAFERVWQRLSQAADGAVARLQRELGRP